MSAPAHDELLRERLDRLANSVSGGDAINGVQLYRRGVRRRRIAVTAGVAAAVVVVASAAAVASVVGAGGSSSPGPASDPSPPTPDTCVLPADYAELVDAGAMTRGEACRRVRADEQRASEADQFPDGPSLVIEDHLPSGWAAQCRAGTYDSSAGGEEVDALYCNAILKIADGELEPNGTCDPPECPEPDTPVWAYSEEQLRDLMDQPEE
jgi:hypothetical protein